MVSDRSRRITLNYDIPEVYQIELETNASGRIKTASVISQFAYREIGHLVKERYSNPNDALYVVERICGICSHSHTLAFCCAVEKALGTEVPPRAAYIRSIVAELERLQSHLLNLVETATQLRENLLEKELWSVRQAVTSWLLTVTANRIHYGVNCIGGVTRDLKEGDRRILQRELPNLMSLISDIERGFKDVSQPRLQNLGVWTPPLQGEYGTGPNQRAYGWSHDIRIDMPYAAYAQVKFDPPIGEKGDAWSRVLIRLRELEVSCYLLRDLLHHLPRGELTVGELPSLVDAAEATVSVEAPRGENRYILKLSADGTVADLEIHVPTRNSVRGLEKALQGNDVDDTKLVVSSFDLCMSCYDGP